MALPPLAILLSGWLPFVNQPRLWFGMPSVMVWIGMWCLLTAPILWLALGTFAEDDRADEAEIES